MPKYEITPGKTALLVIDMSNDFVAEGAVAEFPKGRAMVPRLAQLINGCRDAGVAVIYFTVSWKADGSDVGRVADTFPGMMDSSGKKPRTCIAGTPGIGIYPGLAPGPGDTVIEKQRFSAFIGTDLENLLHSRGLDTVLITGVAANGCCESTARDAVNRDFKVIYVSDCNATVDLPDIGWGPVTAEETMRVLLTEMAFSTAEVISSGEILARLSAPAHAS